MYDRISSVATRQPSVKYLLAAVVAIGQLFCSAASSDAQIISSASDSLVYKIGSPSEKLELTTNTSRILTLERKIPRVQVNNPELLSVTPLSATQVQVSAKKAGVTQVNLWDEEGKIHTVDVFIYGDVRELDHALKTQFPNSSIRVYRYSNALVLTGFIDRPDYVTPIVELAQDYSPKVINNISVGGVQQVLLKVKVFEVSRTKLRRLGTDFSLLNSTGGFLSTSTSGLVSNTTNLVGGINSIVDSGGQTVEFGIVNGGQGFFGLLEALQQNSLAKILAEPNIVAVSGRPAQFNEGGEIPIIVPQSLGTVSIEYKKFGTQVDFLPIVLGNGNIRLEVRPRISELDFANAVTVNNTQIPALTVREVDTAVEMKAGQTFAIAGLIQRRNVALNRGVPILADIPVLGVPFRRTQDSVNEIELLILVTPEFIDPMERGEVPNCYPGAGTISPNNSELYLGGHIEVASRCNNCGPQGCTPVHGHTPCCPGEGCGIGDGANRAGGCADGSCGGGFDASNMMAADPAIGPMMAGQEAQFYQGQLPPGAVEIPMPQPAPIEGSQGIDAMPVGTGGMNLGPQMMPGQHGQLILPPPPGNRGASLQPPAGAKLNPYQPPRRSEYQRQASRPYSPNGTTAPGSKLDSQTGLIGPVGYDAE